MVELRSDTLRFSFPELHEDAVLDVSMNRTLRVPDDDTKYPLPPGLGHFPLRHVDDCSARLPTEVVERGGVLMPMYQAEAVWIGFDSPSGYPFAVKVATGKINAVSGKGWSEGLRRKPQDYVVVPGQLWLDGYCVAEGVVRQFVAMPLGKGYTAEEQVTDKSEYGGIQILAVPLKPERYVRPDMEVRFSLRASSACVCESAMGIAPGGTISQKVHADRRVPDEWHQEARSRCFVHLMNSVAWHRATGSLPPHKPPTAHAYALAGLPWFEHYDERAAIAGSQILAGLSSALDLSLKREDLAVPMDPSQSGMPVNTIKATVAEWNGT